MAKKKEPEYGVWRNFTKEELKAMQKNKQTDNKSDFEKTIRTMAKTQPISNKDIIEFSKKRK